MKRTIVADVETTGLHDNSHIISLAWCIANFEDFTPPKHLWLREFNPGVPIPEIVTQMTGYTNQAVKDFPKFSDSEAFEEFLTDLREADAFCGYNVLFDWAAIRREYSRCGRSIDKVFRGELIDIKRWYMKLHPNTLSDVYRRVCGKEPKDAHQADADVRMTWEIASILAPSMKHSHPDHLFEDGLENKLKPAHQGYAINFGEHRGQLISEVPSGYLRWILRRDFPPKVKSIIERELHER